MLLEHDAKALLAARGLPVPPGVLATGPMEVATPVMVKAQVPVGGRGKAGGIRLARDPAARDAAVTDLLGMTIKGHAVRAVRLETPVAYVGEAYLSLTLDAGSARILIMMSPHGGVEVEDEATRADLHTAEAALDPAAMLAAATALADRLPEPLRAPLKAAAAGLIHAFFAYEALLIEVNPLFLTADGGWTIGDAKLVVDDNGFARHQEVSDRIAAAPLLYPQEALKLVQGYDFVRLDEEGDIGLVTTGAGLSMQLIDELVARGRRPFNFCDIRTGMFRGDPGRLIEVLRWLAQGRQVRVVLVNFFAGLTDLGEIARLLLQALAAVPELEVPVVARLIGNNLDEALAVIAASDRPIAVETDLEQAIARALAL